MFRRDAGQNSVVNSRVNFGAKVVHKAVERAEGWQVYRRRLQCLDRPIDEVCGVAHGFGGLEGRSGNQLLGRVAIWRHGKTRPDLRLVAIERFGPTRLFRPRRHGQSKLRRQMRHRIEVNFLTGREAAEVLSRFQQGRHHQSPRLGARALPNESQIGIGQRISSVEFLAGQSGAQARVGSAIDGCHKVSSKGVAIAVGRSLRFEGDGR
jgi:hypothetical protein